MSLSIPETALETRLPFTRAQGLAAGITEKQLRGPRYRRIFTGTYVEARVPDHPLVSAQAALLLHPPGAWASHSTAARILGVPVPGDPDTHVSVRRAGDRRHIAGIRPHVGTPREVEVHGGIRVSGPHQLFLELACVLPLVDLVVAGDALVRLGRTTPGRLVEACKASRGRHSVTALRAARYVRADVDSPMETRLRMLLVLAGLPEPEINVRVRDRDGRVLRRYDLCYPSVRLIVEYDGRQHVEVLANWESDLRRREEIDDREWRILVVTSSGIYRTPGETVDRVHRALRRTRLPGVPTRPSDAWRPHFPGRA